MALTVKEVCPVVTIEKRRPIWNNFLDSPSRKEIPANPKKSGGNLEYYRF